MDNEVIENNNTQTVKPNRITNRCALGSFVCALIGLAIAGIPCGIAAIITGILGITQTSANPETQKGKWMAIVGVILGAFDLIMVVVALPIILNMVNEIL